MFRSMLAVVAAVSVVGCTAQTLTATPDGISIKYNRNFTDFMAVEFEANQHCSQYDKVASLADTTIPPIVTLGDRRVVLARYTHTRTFRCVDYR